MEDFIVIGVIVLLCFFGLRATKKHVKGEGGCCGGGSSLPRQRKHLERVVGKKIVKIDGMTCENCRNRVERAINQMDGVAARVNLRKKEAVVSYTSDLDEEALRRVVEKAGYEVLEIL